MSVKSNKSQRKQPAPTLTETMSDHLPSPIGSTKLPSLTKAELTSPIQQQHPTSSSTSKKTQPLILINQHQDETAVANAASSLVASSISQVKLKLSPSTLPLPSTGSYNSMSLTNSLSSVISVSSSSCASINTNNLIKASHKQITTVRGWAVKFKNKLILFNNKIKCLGSVIAPPLLNYSNFTQCTGLF